MINWIKESAMITINFAYLFSLFLHGYQKNWKLHAWLMLNFNGQKHCRGNDVHEATNWGTVKKAALVPVPACSPCH